jgi:N-acetylmuramoyl-L-alanine amidase
MKILNHQLVAEGSERVIAIHNSPNQKDLITADRLPKDLIIHYTAASLESTIGTFMSANGTSAHLVIGLDGSVHQLVPFNRQAFHAGSSIWDNNSGFNGRAIGIEMVNMGWDSAALPDAQTININHKHRFVNKNRWQKYPQVQLNTLYKISKLLLSTYDLLRVLGHDDISAGRKQDPGPAFSWDEFRTEVLGSSSNIGKIFKVKTDGTNLRKGHGVQFDAIQQLNKGFEVGLIETFNNWSEVYLANDPSQVVITDHSTNPPKQKSIKTMGWIRSDLIELK